MKEWIFDSTRFIYIHKSGIKVSASLIEDFTHNGITDDLIIEQRLNSFLTK